MNLSSIARKLTRPMSTNPATMLNRGTGSGEQDSQRHRRHEPGEGENRRNAREIALGGSGTQRGCTTTTEHVRQTTAATAVQENPHDHRDHCHDVDDDGDPGDERTHGSQAIGADAIPTR